MNLSMRKIQFRIKFADSQLNIGEGGLMLHRFLTLSQIPEIRTEPNNPEAGLTDIEILIPVDVLWQIEEIIKELKFLKSSGCSTSRLQGRLVQLMRPYIVNERDRNSISLSRSAA